MFKNYLKSIQTINAKIALKYFVIILIYFYSHCFFVSIAAWIYTQSHNEIISLIHNLPVFCIISIVCIISCRLQICVCYLIFIICALTGAVHIGHTHIYGSYFNTESASAILSTNSEEIQEFVNSFVDPKLLTVYICYISISWILLKKTSTFCSGYKLSIKSKIHFILICALFYTSVAALRHFRTPFDPYFPITIIKKFVAAEKEIQTAAMLQTGYAHPTDVAFPGPQTLLLVIGESASRRNMHLYGYPRQTTPYMERLDGLHVFTDVISSAPTTQKSIGRMLTLADLKGAPYTTTVFDMFEAAGFKTFWLSAQFSGHSTGAGIVPILAGRADFLWSCMAALPPEQRYDEVILPQLCGCIDDPAPRKLIVVNILGSHSEYRKRIPPHRQDVRFTDGPPPTTLFRNFHDHENVAAIINEYDASIRYTDFVVSQFFESLEKRSRGAWAAVYLSDHGEEVFDTENRFGHAGSSASRNVYEIPFVLRISSDYGLWLRDAGIFSLDTDRPYQTDSLIHTLLNLATITTALYDPTKSIVHPDFQAQPRWINGQRYVR